MTHALLASHIANKLGVANTIVDSKTVNITGTLSATQMDELVRVAGIYNASVNVTAGVVVVKTN